MANIVIAMYRISSDPLVENSMPPYYEGLIEGLKKEGNNILCIYHDKNGATFENQEITSELLEKITTFNPQLFILFNYDFYNIVEYFTCPVLIWDVDSPNRYANSVAITENPSRYKFVTIQEEGKKLIIERFPAVQENQIRYIKPFTELKNKNDVEQRNLIGFCGSHWLWSGCTPIFDFMKTQPSEKERLQALHVLKTYKEHPFGDTLDIYESECINCDKKLGNAGLMLAGRLSGIKRAEYLTELVDLGLEIRGFGWNHPSLNFFPEIALCYNRETTVTLNQNSAFYNSIKIGFNINHIQAVSGYSWRVCDILASNSCLVSQYTPGLKKEFSEIDIQLYNNKAEARRTCEKLMNNEAYRERIVDEANQIIEEKFRFKNILPSIEEISGVMLKDVNNEKGDLEYINITNVVGKVHNKYVPKFHDKVERAICRMLLDNLKKKGMM